MSRPVVTICRIRVVCGCTRVVKVAAAQQRLGAHKEGAAFAAMRVCHTHGALTNASSCLLEHALHGARTVGSCMRQRHWRPVLQEVDASAVAESIGCRGGPAAPTLALVNDKGSAAEPFLPRVEELGDIDLRPPCNDRSL